MVNVKIVIEGAVLPHDNVNAMTIDNSEKFRESFHYLLSKDLDPAEFKIEIEIGSSNKQSVKSFKQLREKDNCILLIDLDAAPKKRVETIAKLELAEYADFVFFMVQEMEAWILSQPDCIIQAYSETLVRRKNNVDIKDDDIFKKQPEQIANPTYGLTGVLKKYFEYEKNGQWKIKTYGKLKDAPLLLMNIDVEKLKATFSDVQQLYNYILAQ